MVFGFFFFLLRFEICVSTFPLEAHLTLLTEAWVLTWWERTLFYFILMTRVLLFIFYFTLSLHFTPGLQSAVCILPPVCRLQSVVCILYWLPHFWILNWQDCQLPRCQSKIIQSQEMANFTLVTLKKMLFKVKLWQKCIKYQKNIAKNWPKYVRKMYCILCTCGRPGDSLYPGWHRCTCTILSTINTLKVGTIEMWI